MKNNKIIVSIVIVLLVYALLTITSNFLKEMNESLVGGFDELAYLITGGFLTAYNSQSNKREEIKDVEIANGNVLNYHNAEKEN